MKRLAFSTWGLFFSILLSLIMVSSLLPHEVLAQELRLVQSASVQSQAEKGNLTAPVIVITLSPPLEINTNAAMLKCELNGLGDEERV